MTDHFHLVFAPEIPRYALALLGGVALLLVIYTLFHRGRGAVGRAGIFGLLLLALANPSLIAEKREPLKDTALLVVDDSASMRMGDRESQSKQVVAAMTQKLTSFNDLDVETVHVSGGDETDLFHVLDDKLSLIPQDRLAGIIAITDGQIHDKPEGVWGAPFHAVIAGHRKDMDRRLHILTAPAYGIVGHSVAVKLRIDDAPGAQSANVTVTLRHDDGSSDALTLPVGKDVSFNVPVSHAGQNLFVFSTDSLPGELTEINNTAAVTVNGIRDRLRVLLVSGEPHIGGRTWRNLLKADPSVDLIHFTILRSPAKQDMTPNNELALIAFPVHELFATKLKSFDLVIFDRFRNQSLLQDEYLENIAHYVEDGGALLISSATDEAIPTLTQSPLARVLPTEPIGTVLTGAFVPELTEAGKRHPVTDAMEDAAPRSSWGPWLRQTAAQVRVMNGVKPDVLMTGLEKQPLLVLGHAGTGRVAQFLSDQFWLWSRGYEGGGPQAELLRRLAHWLVQEPELDETALRAHAETSDQGWQIVITKHSLDQNSANVSLIDPHGQSLEVTLTAQPQKPGVLQATMPAAEAGLYHVKDGDRDVLVLTGPVNAPEYGDVVATDAVVKPIADATSGSVTWLDDHADGPAIKRVGAHAATQGWGWIGLRQNGQYRITGSAAYPLLPFWLWLTVTLAVAMLVWRCEGKNIS
jgi:uncharacterized membrane protein